MKQSLQILLAVTALGLSSCVKPHSNSFLSNFTWSVDARYCQPETLNPDILEQVNGTDLHRKCSAYLLYENILASVTDRSDPAAMRTYLEANKLRCRDNDDETGLAFHCTFILQEALGSLFIGPDSPTGTSLWTVQANFTDSGATDIRVMVEELPYTEVPDHLYYRQWKWPFEDE